MTSSDEIRLCTDCRLRAVADADADHRLIPCGARPDLSLSAAREQCQGNDWHPLAGRMPQRGEMMNMPAEAEFAMSARLGAEGGAGHGDLSSAAYGVTTRTERYADQLAAAFIASGLADGTIVKKRGRYFVASAAED
ncbi:MAG: hypothetical protein HQL38_07950 [Alphaproteobacteria bacterium]|nr:hypothetical protein [Alphaproteobacteria bacterium]